jgi:hypothetical protein
MTTTRDDTIAWLLADDADPAIRWQAMRDLTDATPDAVATERARMTTEGWASDLLGAQGADGRWGDHGPDWVSWQHTWRDTMYTAWLVADFGVDPEDPRVRTVVERLRDGVRWDEEGLGDTPYFAGEIEPCTNGMVLKTGAALGELDPDLAELLLSEQLDDGGWNCDAPVSQRSSFHGTICVMEGLLAAEQAGVATPGIPESLRRAQDYLLDRGMFRSLRTGLPINPEWSLFAYPYSWHYDVLRGLDHLRVAGVAPDERAADAIALVESRRSTDGTWPRDAVSSERVRYAMEEVGAPSRWNTLRALRVLDWYGG